MTELLPPEWFVIVRVFARDEREARLVAHAVLDQPDSDVQVIPAVLGDEEEPDVQE